MRIVNVPLLLAALAAQLLSYPGHAQDLSQKPSHRRPVSIVLNEDETRLYVANRRSGTISILDTASLRVLHEVKAGTRLAGAAYLVSRGDPVGRASGTTGESVPVRATGPVAPTGYLLVLDEERHELLVLDTGGSNRDECKIIAQLPVSPYPVSIAVADDGRMGTVASLWSKRLDLIDLSTPESPVLLKSLELPFFPREQALLPRDSLLAVADSFGGHLALIDLAEGRLVRILELPGHNIRGLASTIDKSQLLVSLQDVDSTARTNRDDIIWGVLMSNTLLSIPLERLLDGGNTYLHSLRFLPLGQPSGDPQRVAVNAAGEVAVALGGVRRVAVGRHTWPQLDHIPVGSRPADLTFGADGRLYVANTLSDSITVIDAKQRKPIKEISLGPQLSLEKADQGEMLFYDATLSLRGWMSCHSCHSDGHSSGIVVDTLGDNTYGAPKRVPSLFDVAETGPWAWNGGMSVLKEQIRKSLETTMRARNFSMEQVSALEAFLRKLRSPRLAPSTGADAIERGERAFRAHRCYRCHTPSTYTSKGARDVGLSDAAGNTRFNPPSLLGVRYRTTFFHDARALSLQDVFASHQHPVALPPEEISDLIAFLSTLQPPSE